MIKLNRGNHEITDNSVIKLFASMEDFNQLDTLWLIFQGY